MRLSIVIPAHNEEESLDRTLKDLRGNVKAEHEILVVDDHSADTTSDVVKKYADSYKNIKLVKYDKSDGVYPLGTWVRYGFDNNRIDVGDGVPDFAGPPPPPSPKIEVYFDNNDVVVEWASKEFYELQDGTESFFGPVPGTPL